MDRISEGSESDKSAPSRKERAAVIVTSEKDKAPENQDASERSSSSMQEVIEEASQLDSEKTSSAAMKIKTTGPSMDRASSDIATTQGKNLKSLKDEELSYSMDFSDAGSTLAQSHSKVTLGSKAVQDLSIKDAGGSEAGEISEHIVVDEPSSVASAARSPASLSSQLKFDFKSGSKSAVDGESLPPSTGIQESDSETESR